LKNSQPFGKKLTENCWGDFLTHTVYTMMWANNITRQCSLSISWLVQNTHKLSIITSKNNTKT